MMKTLIAYYSRAGENYVGGEIRRLKVGNTKAAANMLAEAADADVFEIEQAEPYADDYMTCIDEAKRDQQADARPELVRWLDSIDAYDTVYLAYPNYWGTMPMAVFTFLERYDFTGKTIRPLCTNEGSGMGASERDIRRLCPGATVGRGLSVTGGEVTRSREKIERWAKEGN